MQKGRTQRLFIMVGISSQGKMNAGEALRYIWHDLMRRIKVLVPIMNAIYNTSIYKIIVRHMDYRYDIYHSKEIVEQSRAYFMHNEDRIEIIKSRLADKKSRLVYDSMIRYRCTHHPKYLKGIIDKNQYFDKNLIKFNNKEIFVDCGAYDGDSIKLFLKNLREGGGRYKEIIALEPDPCNYKALIDWITSLSRGGRNLKPHKYALVNKK